MPRVRTAAIIVGTCVLAGLGLASPGAAVAAPSSGSGAAAGSVQVWATTADGTDTLTPLAPASFGPAPADAPSSTPVVVVDPTLTYQQMQGFGGAITDASASVLYTLNPAQRAAAMASLFSPETGDGLDFLRQPIGGSDMVATAPYTYDDLPAGQTDYAMKHFSIAHDQAQILPLLREAKQLNPKLQIMASPWSPPAWMKTSDSLDSGQLIDSPAVYHAYALYLLKFLEAYQANGVTVNQITVQNEPQDRTTGTYPGTDMPSSQEEAVIEQLGPMIKAAGLHTQIFAYDHNWSEDPNDIADTPSNETADINDYPEQVMNSPAAKWVSGVAFHCYYGDPSAMTAFHDQYPNVAIEETECSGSESADPANTFSDTLQWHARNLELGSTINWSSTVVNWDLALNQDNGPHDGGCSTCTGIITVNSDGTVTDNAEYYALGQLARFVQPGALHIASTSFGTTGWNGQIMDVAFRNPDGSTVLVAHNEYWNPLPFSVREGSQQFTYTLPAQSIVTFTWPGSEPGSYALRQVAPSGWTATASPSPAASSGDQPANAVDGDASTRYSTDAGQAPGDYLQVDFGRALPLRKVVFDAGANLGDYPVSYTAQVSVNGTDWTTVADDAAGTGQFTTLSLNGAPVRYVKITLDGSSGSWWSVADVRAYVAG